MQVILMERLANLGNLGDVARRMSELAVGAAIRCEGFLARRYRSGTSVALHITGFTNEVS